MKIVAYLWVCIMVFSTTFAIGSTEPVVTAKKYIEYKRKNGHITEFVAPKIVLVCYQQSSLDYLLKNSSSLKESDDFSNLYLTDNGQVGILGGWGWGAPALAGKMEQLIALGVTKFIAVGTAGTLLNKHPVGSFIIAPKALGEDGVAHHYLQGKSHGIADEKMIASWADFIKSKGLPSFHTANAWSFSAIFKETPADIIRVSNQGYDVVEMEAATLYAIGKEKGVQTLSLFVISDSLTLDNWVPHIKEPLVRDNVHNLATWALEFCEFCTINE